MGRAIRFRGEGRDTRREACCAAVASDGDPNRCPPAALSCSSPMKPALVGQPWCKTSIHS